MDLSTKTTLLKESIKTHAEGRTSFDPDLLVKASGKGTQFPHYWLEIKRPKQGESHIHFVYFARKSDSSDIEEIGQGDLVSAGAGFKIQGLAITQPLGNLSPDEAGGMLLSRLDELSGLDTKQAMRKLTGGR